MKMIVLASSLTAVLAVGCQAQQVLTHTRVEHRAEPAPVSHSMPATAPGECPEPENLLPFDADDGDIEKRIARALLGDVSTDTWLVCLESMRPSRAIALLAPSANAIPGSQSSGTWQLLVADAADFFDGPNSAPRVWRHLIPIDDEMAKSIADAWREVVGRARYPSPIRSENSEDPPFDWLGSLGSDGATYLFGSDRYRGRIWSPERGIPGDIVKLADGLYELAGFDPFGSEPRMRECREMAWRLFETARLKPW